MSDSSLLTFLKAHELVLQNTHVMDSESIGVVEANGRILSATVQSEQDLPPFITSAVDGYAIADTGQTKFAIVGEMRAGTRKTLNLHHGEAVQVFTGSPLPNGAEAIVMLEDAERQGEVLSLNRSPAKGDYLRSRGEELTAGQAVGLPGQRVIPARLALLISSGVRSCPVFKRPSVSIVEIGDELQEVGSPLEAGAVYACNGPALAAAVVALGAEPRLFRTSDDPTAMATTFEDALKGADVVISSGGVSVGKHDHTKQAWQSLGVQPVFWRAAIRPGKPIFFGRSGAGQLVFGLPGNPVSTLVTFFLFVRPALLKLQGLTGDRWVNVQTAERQERAPNLDVFTRVRLEDSVAYKLAAQGSHMSTGLADADALLWVPQGTGEILCGSTLKALPLTWSF